MGTITFTVIGSFGTRTKDFTVSDAHVDRLVAAWQVRAAASGNPSPSVNDALIMWSDSMMAITKSDVQLTERQVADNAILPIDAS